MWEKFINRHIYYLASVIFIVLGLVYFVACLERPYIGLDLKNVNGHWLVVTCDSIGEAYQSGIELGDEILKIDGKDPSKNPIVQKWDILEDATTIEFVSPGQMTSKAITIHKQIDLFTALSEIPLIILGFTFWLLGFLTWYKRPFLKQARTLFWMLWLFALAIILTRASGRCLLLAKELEFVTFSLAPVYLIRFFSIFPVDQPRKINKYGQLSILIILTFIIILTIMQFSGIVQLARLIRNLSLLNMLIGIIISIWNLSQVIKLPKERPEKNEAGITLLGMIIGFLPNILFVAIPLFFTLNIRVYTELSFLFVAAIPISLYYVIANKYLPDSRRLYEIIITNSLAGIIISILTYFILYKIKFIQSMNFELYLAVFILSILFIICFYLIRTTISKIFNNNISQSKSGVKQRIIQLEENTTLLLAKDQLFEDLIQNLGIDGAFVIVENEQTGCFEKSVGRFKNNCKEQSKLEGYFRQNQKLDLEAEFIPEEFPAEVFVPFVSHNSRCGIFFGHRYSHVKFDKSELPFLTLLAGQLAYQVLMQLVVVDLTKEINYLNKTFSNSHRRNRELQRITNSLIRMIERGKGSLAKEILDGPVQSVLDISRWLKILEKENIDDDMFQQAISRMRDLINDLNYDLNQTVHNLLPPILADLGLIPAIQLLFQDIMLKEPSFILLETEGIGLDDRFPEDIEIAAYRFIQKGIINSLRYSGSKKQTVRVKLSGDKLELTVRDNGQGFDPDQLGKGFLDGAHSGLAIMKERIERLGGQILISSGMERGTTLQATIPIY
ncbi:MULTISPECIES: ATP-binding protein [unclassified Dehalobacter]|uniref:sensor histidine kinase n=1 Tax=unclassified Dehalobacter TaxID=2635733 RepID=UPI000E6B629E|nr:MULTISPECIES: ATP-binding protein [unclassified Dehalobacter]RJE47972.1 histidine kinase [Dehalobacter sp. MCB1]TCX50620.1 histidine kinase [Dehalobacter sp. 14DCB1]TCX52136.1 histidine kinase [Dehalobacter sp. 12DCB1]